MNDLKKTRKKRFTPVISLLIIFLVGWTLFHHIMLKVEEDKIKPIGKLVSVNGHEMHVYSEGENQNGVPTLVFLSGSGTAAPIYDFKILYKKFSKKYHIVVIERSGYGYSEVSGVTRDLDTILGETRGALQVAGEEPPYILLPHSISGIESLYWAQVYPAEVKGIIGLDMSVPQSAKNIVKIPFSDELLKFSGFVGFQRISFFYPIDYVGLTNQEKQQAKYLTYRNGFDQDIRHEMDHMMDSFKKIDVNKLNVPILDFVSKNKDSREAIREFAKRVSCQLVNLDCGHYVYHYESDQIYQKGSEFIEEILVN